MLQLASDRMKSNYDRRCKPAPEYQPGDQIMLDIKDLRLDIPARKLAERRVGPPSILEKVGASAYRIQLPLRWKDVHDVFPEVKLIPWKPPFAAHQATPPPLEPDIIEGEPEYKVEEILDSKAAGRGVKYLVKWKYYPREECTWEPLANIIRAKDALRDYVRRYQERKPMHTLKQINVARLRRGLLDEEDFPALAAERHSQAWKDSASV